jgi:hypothetical protein
MVQTSLVAIRAELSATACTRAAAFSQQLGE